MSRSYAYKLLAAGILESVRVGNARVILTSPAEYLARFKDAA
jgi:hypothetical protein